MARESAHGKQHPAIAACGIDCGLCPLHHRAAGDGCGGCTAPAPSGTKGRWCAIARCAVRDHGYETCAECPGFPCALLNGWDEAESVVTHARTLDNLRVIREGGLDGFLEQQRRRIELLTAMLDEFDEGRSKSRCCLACALLPVEELEKALDAARREVGERDILGSDRKARAEILRQRLEEAATRLNVTLKLRRG